MICQWNVGEAEHDELLLRPKVLTVTAQRVRLWPPRLRTQDSKWALWTAASVASAASSAPADRLGGRHVPTPTAPRMLRMLRMVPLAKDSRGRPMPWRWHRPWEPALAALAALAALGDLPRARVGALAAELLKLKLRVSEAAQGVASGARRTNVLRWQSSLDWLRVMSLVKTNWYLDFDCFGSQEKWLKRQFVSWPDVDLEQSWSFLAFAFC